MLRGVRMTHSFSSKVILEWSASHCESIGSLHYETLIKCLTGNSCRQVRTCSHSELHATQKLHKAVIARERREAIRSTKNPLSARLSGRLEEFPPAKLRENNLQTVARADKESTRANISCTPADKSVVSRRRYANWFGREFMPMILGLFQSSVILGSPQPR